MMLATLIGATASAAEPEATACALADLGTLGGSTSHAVAVNNQGQVIGNSLTEDGSTHAFLWTAQEGMIDLGTLDGATSSSAAAINERGQVVGASGGHAFSWTAQGGMVDLGTLGGSSSNAVAVNNQGQVIGDSLTADGSTHAFAWTCPSR